MKEGELYIYIYIYITQGHVNTGHGDDGLYMVYIYSRVGHRVIIELA